MIALGAVVAISWWLARPITLVIGVDRVSMTLNSAVSFILAGLALKSQRPATRLALAVMLMVPSLLTLVEHSFQVNLFIDHLFGTSWSLQDAPHVGRMAPQTAAAFVLGSLACIVLTRPRYNRLAWFPPLAAALILLIALVSLFGRTLRLDIVYDWHYAARVAPHTAVGMLLLAMGIMQLTYRRAFDKSDDVSNDARRILTVSSLVMLTITIACAAMCFAVVVRHSHDLQQTALKRELQNQVELISSELNARRQEADRIVSSPSLEQIMRLGSLSDEAGRDISRLLEALHGWAEHRLPLSNELHAATLSTATGRAVFQTGAFAPPSSMIVPLDEGVQIEVGEQAHLLIEAGLPPDAAGHRGTIRMQFSLPRLTAELQPDSVHSFESAVCRTSGAHSVQCMRLSQSPGARDARRTGALNLAFAGETGVTLGVESDGARFFAAYGPIHGTPLAMTLTASLDTLYSDLRRRLNVLLLLMIGLVAAAAWVVRWQLAPLIAKVVAARSRANDSAMHLAAIMDTASDGIITVNRAGTVLTANPAFHRLLSADARPLIGENLVELLPGLDLQLDEHGVPSLAHCAGEPALDLMRETAQGDTLYLQMEFAWLNQATRSTLVATVRDLTRLKQGELALRDTHAKLQHSEGLYRDQATRLATLFDSVDDAIVVINASGQIESWNRGAQHMFGYAAEDIIGKDVRLLMPEPHALTDRAELLRFVQTGERTQTGRRIELEGRHGGGRIVPLEVSVREMIIDGQRLYGAVMHDISVRREVERMKSEFVSTISHELRTPLTSIAGSLALISGGAAGETPPKVARLVGIARQNSERLIRLINDILDLEKAEAGKLDFQLAVRSLRAEVASIAEFNRGFAQGLGVAIEVEPGDDAEVLIDSDRLAQVLTNLISNAAKFSPTGGTVRVRIDREASGVRVTVSDRGPGIAPEFRSRIFQKFAQADASDSRLKGGTGLGLSIAKTITEKLGGRIGFDTETGQGSSFYIVLPIHHAGVDNKADAQRALFEEPTLVEVDRTGQPGESLPSILHVEDDQSLTAIVREAMSKNAKVTSARSVAAARQMLSTQHFDAVILDVSLPDGSGIDLLPIVVGEHEHPPVIVSYTADEPSRAWRGRVDAALIKSRHSVAQLLVTVLAHIDASRSRAERQDVAFGSNP